MIEKDFITYKSTFDEFVKKAFVIVFPDKDFSINTIKQFTISNLEYLLEYFNHFFLNLESMVEKKSCK